MEGQKLPDRKKEPCNYAWASFIIFMYEFLGVIVLISAINISQGNVAAIGFTLFMILLVTGPISGGHLNPAVSLGVLINRGATADRTLQCFIMILAQMSAAVVATEINVALLQEGNRKIASKIPVLTLNTAGYQQALAIELCCTYVFVTANLLIKDPKVRKHVVGGSTWLGCATIAITLVAMHTMAAPKTGGAINPAVSLAQKMAQGIQSDVSHFRRSFWEVYMLGPALGGCVAGVLSWFHAQFIEEWAARGSAEEPKDEEAD